MVAPPNEADYYWGDVQVVEDTDGVLKPWTRCRTWPTTTPTSTGGCGAGRMDTTIPIRPTRIPSMEAYAGYWVKAKQANVFLRFDPGAQIGVPGHSSETLMARSGKRPRPGFRT